MEIETQRGISFVLLWIIIVFGSSFIYYSVNNPGDNQLRLSPSQSEFLWVKEDMCSKEWKYRSDCEIDSKQRISHDDFSTNDYEFNSLREGGDTCSFECKFVANN